MSLEETFNELLYGGPQIRVRAAERLADMADSRAVPLLVQELQDNEPEVRAAVAKALQAFRDPNLAPALLPLLNDVSWPVRAAVATTLGYMGNTIAVKPMIKLIEASFWQEVRILPQHLTLTEATIALGRLRDPQSTHLLAQLLKKGYKTAMSDWTLDVRMAAAIGLGYLDNRESVTTLLKFLVDKEPEKLRQAIITGLATCRSEESFQLMLKALSLGTFEDKTQVWRRLEGVTIAFGMRGETRAVPYLLPLAQSVYPEVRLALARTMVRLDAVQGGQVLINLLRDRMAEVRAAAALALGELQIAAAAVPLLAVAQDPDKNVAAAAQSSIEAIKLLGTGQNPNATRLLNDGSNLNNG